MKVSLGPGVKTDRPQDGSLANSAWLSLVLAMAYFGLGMVASLLTGREVGTTCMVFLPEGVSLLFVVLFGSRVAGGIFVGQLVLGMWLGLPPAASAAIGVVNTLQAVLGGWLFRRWRISPRLNGARDIGLLFILSGVILQPISATGGVLAQVGLAGLPLARVPDVWIYWWSGNTLGQLLLLPLGLTWSRGGLSNRERREISQALLAVGAFLMVVFLYSFGDSSGQASLLRLAFFATFYLTLVWVAVQSGVRTVSLISVLMTVLFLWEVTSGPYILQFFSGSHRQLAVDFFVLASLLTALLISALWEQLTARRRQLREANAARERLFSVIGHDLNSPIATLETSLDLLIAGDLTPEEFRELQYDLRKGVGQARQTLENLMAWGNQQMTATVRPRLTPMSLRLAATEAIQLLTLVAEQKRITVVNTIPEGAMVEADMIQIQSVLRNLLANALKFTPEGGRVTFSAGRREGHWHTSVSDNGIGMPADRAARIFKADNEYVSTLGTANERGLGLGLQLCRDFIAAHKGTITVESREGEGTTFTFVLPTTGPKLSIKKTSAPKPEKKSTGREEEKV